MTRLKLSANSTSCPPTDVEARQMPAEAPTPLRRTNRFGSTRPRVALLAVIGLYLALATATAVVLPPFEAKDESDHVRNVEALVAGHYYRIPPSLSQFVGFEPHQPPLYYALLAGWQRLLGESAFTPYLVPRHATGFVVSPLPGQSAYQHTTLRETADDTRVIELRIAGVLLGALTILLTAMATRLVARDRWTPVIAAAIVAFIPRFVLLSALVTNDNLANTLAAAAVALGVIALTRPERTARRKVLIPTLLGVALAGLTLTKASTLALAPALALAAFLSAADRREGAKLVAITLGTALVLVSPWLILNTAWYGDPLAITATRNYLGPFLARAAGPLKTFFVDLPRHVWKNFWYTNGWLRSTWAWWAYLPFWLLSVVGLAAATRSAREPQFASSDARGPAIWFLAAFAVCAVAIVWILGLETPVDDARTGFVGLPAIACLLALGFESSRWSLLVRFALPAILLIASVVGFQTSVISVYG